MPRSALIIAHPGHELRVHHWLESARPIVFVLTDGSGSAGRSRVASTLRVLDAAGAQAGAIMGRFPDQDVYRAILAGELDAMTCVTNSIADALVEQDVDCVVADACEFYNPAHDLCHAMAALATERAWRVTGRTIETYEYAVVGTPEARGVENERVLVLDDAALQRKIDAAMQYAELRKDVEIALRLDHLDAFRFETLRPVAGDGRLPVPDARPYYEHAGEEQVAAGRYATVLRHDEHFAPFVTALARSVRATPLPS